MTSTKKKIAFSIGGLYQHSSEAEQSNEYFWLVNATTIKGSKQILHQIGPELNDYVPNDIKELIDTSFAAAGKRAS